MRNSALKKECVKDNILFRILSGEYLLKGSIPSERELCNIMNVSRITIRAAVDELAKEGILERDGRRGTLIKKIPGNKMEKKLNKRQGTLLFVYFSSLKGHLIDQSGASAKLYQGIEHFANTKGYGVMVQSGDNFLNSSENISETISGIILGGSQLGKHIPRFLKLGIPMLTVEAITYGLNVDAVCEDNYEAGVKAAQRVIERGCKKPLFLMLKYKGENFFQASYIARRHGFYDTLSEKVRIYEHVINYEDTTTGGASLSEARKIVMKEGIDCIIHAACTTYNPLCKLGGISEVLSIILGGQATDDLPMKGNVDLLVSDLKRIGYLAAERLYERINNPCLETVRILVPVKMKMEQ